MHKTALLHARLAFPTVSIPDQTLSSSGVGWVAMDG
jgi:hypothetical protein